MLFFAPRCHPHCQGPSRSMPRRPHESIAGFLAECACLSRHKSVLVCEAESSWARALAADPKLSTGALIHFLSRDDLAHQADRFANGVMRPALRAGRSAVVLFEGGVDELAAPVDAKLLHTNLAN